MLFSEICVIMNANQAERDPAFMIKEIQGYLDDILAPQLTALGVTADLLKICLPSSKRRCFLPCAIGATRAFATRLCC